MRWLLIVALLGACNGSPAHDNNCLTALDGRQFVHPLDECGACACGAFALCDWVAEFNGSKLDWNSSDTIESADITCTDGEIRDSTLGDVLGSYDADRDEVTIRGATYTACDGACPRRQQGCDCCAGLDGNTFVTPTTHECGLCPSGQTASCDWTIAFDAGTYTWDYSDVSESDSYSCDAGGLQLAGATDVSYFPRTGALTINGIGYELCPDPCVPDYLGCP